MASMEGTAIGCVAVSDTGTMKISGGRQTQLEESLVDLGTSQVGYLRV